ncbi:hypothetical protein CIW49_02290 [Mycolicibacterium sp. P1-18]|uniref:hypothetical protein n=1 Tax=Mycolicibacterium sp. P1-18 TaxID=2024615 RepID=UPI0011F35EE5|nr:hypothetical protein [Mycolicibacterium sp. P1-18]KAA0102175.1 hypothetical protein CIW49_02290 [Mycolicibacterium sp. P1-18]
MPTIRAAMSVIPHGGPAIAIFVGCLFVAVVAAVVAMEMKRKPVPWAATSFVVCLVVLSAGVDVLTH